MIFVAVVQSLSCVQLFAQPWSATCQASLFFTISWSLLKLMSIESVMPSTHLILCHPLLFLPSIFPSISLFQSASSSHQVAKVLELQLQQLQSLDKQWLASEKLLNFYYILIEQFSLFVSQCIHIGISSLISLNIKAHKN